MSNVNVPILYKPDGSIDIELMAANLIGQIQVDNTETVLVENYLKTVASEVLVKKNSLLMTLKAIDLLRN